MRLEIKGEYPANWTSIALNAKIAAGWRCVRCRHPFAVGGGNKPCDEVCDTARCRVARIVARGGKTSLTTHHLDGDKGNCRWWNLLCLCNSCHLKIQSRVIPERPYLFDHSPWFLPYVAGFYAMYYGNLDLTRAEIERDLARFLALGQPWLTHAMLQPSSLPSSENVS
jgi:hypothetical protein